MFPFINFFGRRWYLSTKASSGGLFKYYDRSECYHHLIVCLQLAKVAKLPPKEEGYRLFSFFDSYLDFYLYMDKVPEEYHCFYEIILGEFPQKPHFDIDFSFGEETSDEEGIEKSEEIKNYLLLAIIEVLGKKEILINPEKDLLIFSSHGEKKKSFHIVVNNWLHQNNLDAKGFYNQVMAHIESKYNKYFNKNSVVIDTAVYSSFQQFRILGSHKQGSGRIKVFRQKFNIFDKEYTHLLKETDEEKQVIEIYKKSLVSFSSDSKYLPLFYDPERIERIKIKNDNCVFPEEPNEFMRMYASYFNIPISEIPFSVREVDNDKVLLTKKHSYFCILCSRVHPHENPYFKVIGHQVYWCCRRKGESNKICLGMISSRFQTTNKLEQRNEENNELFEGMENGILISLGDVDSPTGTPTGTPTGIPEDPPMSTKNEKDEKSLKKRRTKPVMIIPNLSLKQENSEKPKISKEDELLNIIYETKFKK